MKELMEIYRDFATNIGHITILVTLALFGLWVIEKIIIKLYYSLWGDKIIEEDERRRKEEEEKFASNYKKNIQEILPKLENGKSYNASGHVNFAGGEDGTKQNFIIRKENDEVHFDFGFWGFSDVSVDNCNVYSIEILED